MVKQDARLRSQESGDLHFSTHRRARHGLVRAGRGDRLGGTGLRRHRVRQRHAHRGGGCKVPGNSCKEPAPGAWLKGYAFKFLATSNLSCQTDVYIDSIVTTGPELTFEDNPIQVAANASSFAVLVNFLSDNSANLAFDVTVTYHFEDCDGDASGAQQLTFTVPGTPPDCAVARRSSDRRHNGFTSRATPAPDLRVRTRVASFAPDSARRRRAGGGARSRPHAS